MRSLAVAILCLAAASPVVSSWAQTPAQAPVAPVSPTTLASNPQPLPEVQALIDRGDRESYNNADAAERTYRQALVMARDKADLVGEERALTSIGNVYPYAKRSADARALFHRALELARAARDRVGETSTLSCIGDLDSNSDRFSDALNEFHHVLLLCRARGDREGQVDVLYRIADVYRRTDHPSEVVSCFEQALLLLEAMGQKGREAEPLLLMGHTYETTGQPRAALSALQRALDICRQAKEGRIEGAILSRIGELYAATGRLSEALATYQQALSIDNKDGQLGGAGTEMRSTGDLYREIGRPNDALAAYQSTLSIDLKHNNSLDAATDLCKIGDAYSDLDRSLDALGYYQQALPIFEATKFKESAALAWSRIGNLYKKMGRPAEALVAFQKALPLYVADDADFDDKEITLTNIGEAYDALGRPAEALSFFRRTRPTWSATSFSAEHLSSKAHAEEELGQWQAADSDYAASSRIVEEIRNGLGVDTSAKQSFLASARTYYARYLDFLLSPHKILPKAGSHESAYAGAGPTTSAVIQAFALAQQTKARSLLDLLDSGQVDLAGALTVDESKQLRDLRQQSDLLNTRMVKEGVENDVGAKRRFEALQGRQREVEDKLRLLTQTLYARHPDLAERRSAKTATARDIAPLLTRDTALLEYVQTARDRLALFTVTKSSGKGASDTFHIRARYVTAPVSLVTDCVTFQKQCADPRRDYRALAKSLYQTLVAPAAAQSGLAGVRRLIICPDGPLWNVPFQAMLTDGGKRFLSDRYEIDYAYSATGALAASNSRWRQKNRSSGSSGHSLLVVANPVFGDAKRFGDLDDLPGQRPLDKPSRPIEKPSRPLDTPSRPLEKPSRPLDTPSRPLETPSRPIDTPSRAMTAVLDRGGRIAPLPGTQREADGLARLFPDATILTGAAAQESTVKRDAPNYRYLHFATHGFFNDAAPMLSSLVLAQPDAADKAGDNGFLTARDIFDLRLPNTEMATLSACNTGRGQIQSGEGVIGLTWALFAAGCPTQVVSQWSVDDACTALLMTRFYTEIKAGKAKGAALHDAALATAHDGVAAHRHPYYWAPFVLFGDWN